MKTFAELMETHTGTLMIVDALNLAFRWKARPTKNKDVPVFQADFEDDYINTIRSLKSSYKAEKVILACDGGYDYRKSIYPEYKQNRKDKYNEEEQLLFNDFITKFNAILDKVKETTKFKVIKYSGVEADDIAAHICNNIKHYRLDHIWLISSDKDWLQLISEHVSKFSFVTREEVTHDNWYDFHDFDVIDYISIKCLHGDSGDNIKGIEGIGEVRAKALLQHYGNAMNIYNNLPVKGTSKYIANLNNSGDTIPRNYKLMDLVNYADISIGAHLTNLREELETYL